MGPSRHAWAMSTSPNPGYDPEPDLEALRASRGASVAAGFMVATAVFELGAFLQFELSFAVGPAWVTAWVWSKAVLVLLALYAAHTVANLRHRALPLWVGVSAVALVESAAWFYFSFTNGFLSLFAPLTILPALVTLLSSGIVKASVDRADLARTHLRESGLGDGF